jgi:hypothetical protein
MKQGFTKSVEHFHYEVVLESKHLNDSVHIRFNTVEGEEVCIDELCISSGLTGPYKGVIVGYQELITGKPVEVLDRLTPKEIDYYLRDETTVPAFEFYGKELYEILSIGELIMEKLGNKDKENSSLFDVSLDGTFKELSFSEQIEYFEEFCSTFIYRNPKFINIFLDIEEVEEESLVLSCEGKIVPLQLLAIEEKFNEEFETSFKFKLLD